MKEIPKPLLILILLIIVVTVGAFWWHYAQKAEPQEAEEIEGTTPIASQNSKTFDGGVVNDLTPISLDREQAVFIFSENRVQMDEDCQMNPKILTTENGSTIMFDNRFRDAQEFSLDGTAYTIPGYGFKLLQLTAEAVPHSAQVVCGEDLGQATIELT